MSRLKRFLTEEWSKPAWASKLETAGAAAGLIVFCGMIGGYVWNLVGGDVSSVLAILTRQVSVPVGVVLGAPIFLLMASAYLMKRLHLRSLESVPPPHRDRVSNLPKPGAQNRSFAVAAPEPHLVSAADPSSALTVGTDVLESPQGTVGLWTFVDDPGRGIRNLKNNRYLVAHAGNKGRMATVASTRAYIDVFALSCSPVDKARSDLIWRFYVSNKTGERTTLKIEDRLSSPHWHHFAVRWDHTAPSLEFLVDAMVVAATADFRSCWPTSLGALTFGSWVSRGAIHFIESKIWRVQIAPRWMTDEELREEMSHLPWARRGQI